MTSLSFSDARANRKAVMDRAVADRAPITITRRKAEGVVIISESEWASIERSIYCGRRKTPNDCLRQCAASSAARARSMR